MNIRSLDGTDVSGPNINKLFAYKMSIEAIPSGGGTKAGLDFLMNKEKMVEAAKISKKWIEDAISLIRTGAEPNPWKTAKDEDIAGELLRHIEKRKQEK